MNQTLNEIKKEVFKLALCLNGEIDQASSASDNIFIAGIRFTYYKQTGLYSIKSCEENFNEISNRYILSLIHQNLRLLWKAKQKNPERKVTLKFKK